VSNGVDIDVSELYGLEGNLREYTRLTGPAANRAVKAAADYLMALALSTVAVYSGDLRDSIGMDSSGAGPNQARRVFALDSAAFTNEYGTSRQAPHPFLMIHSPAALEALEGALIEELDKLPL